MPLIGAKAYRPVISEVRTIARSGSALPSETVDGALRPIAVRHASRARQGRSAMAHATLDPADRPSRISATRGRADLSAAPRPRALTA
jgi:hypothetical protein